MNRYRDATLIAVNPECSCRLPLCRFRQFLNVSMSSKVILLDAPRTVSSACSSHGSLLYYVGTILRPLCFPRKLWSCYKELWTAGDRTNNFCRSSSSPSQTYLDVGSSVTWFAFSKNSRRSRNCTTTPMSNALRDTQRQERERIYLDADKRILSLVLLFERRNLMNISEGWLETSSWISNQLPFILR
uniref:Uncharacterized protein n=1 Tax=Ditylenchus dipsaci TaxID=166011 RepID=A0A915DL29_9BILA